MIRNLATPALMLIACATSACNNGEIRGFLVARFDDGATPFVRRIQLQVDADTPAIRIPLTREKQECGITLQRPAKLDPATGNCQGMAGFGELTCTDGRTAPLSWIMTSCRSGYGVSLASSENTPRFSFGFANNLSSAMNQLDEVRRPSHEAR